MTSLDTTQHDHRDSERDDDAVLRQSRALGDPTRHALFIRLRDALWPQTVAELTAHFGLNHNAIRQHLAHLTDAGLVMGEVVASVGRGRPARRYRVVPGAAERWGGESPHQLLSMMLVDLLRDGQDPRSVGVATGRRLAAEYGSDYDTLQILDGVARRLGFEPRVVTQLPRLEVVLDRCPFQEPASKAPDVICDLHRGIAEGIAARDEHVVITDLIARPPRRAGCRIVIDQAEPESSSVCSD